MVTFSVVQEGPVNALALNRDFSQVAISGRNVFKVYHIEEDKFKETCNLRTSKHLNLSFSCNDISWSTIDEHYLATAATNGHVCVWNLTKMGKAMQEQDYQEHKRTVNKVNFHYSEPNRLISGSQDGTMKYFDIRAKNSVATFHSNTESVRDVQFSPHNAHVFAAVSENGSVQLWDLRRPDKCQQQFTAHSGPVFACDWHPEMQWIATASRDKTIKVWDLSSKPTLEYTIHTIASVGHVKWRPQRKYHIASCALVVDCSINVWDVRRPYIPFAAFNEHKDVSTCVAWRGDPHVFLSTSRDCTLYQHAFKDASRPASKANPQAISVNNSGNVLYACQTPNSPACTFSSSSKVTANILIGSRKLSNTSFSEQFHRASSVLNQFMSMLSEESRSFCEMAKNYMITGESVSNLCEHNANVARSFGQHQVSAVWQILRILYGDQFRRRTSKQQQTCDDNVSFTNVAVAATGGAGSGGDHNSTDNEQKSRGAGGGGGGDTPGAQNSGDDIETEGEDQVDHQTTAVVGFTSYNNFRLGIPRGDFSFGENELDLELDGLGLSTLTDVRNGYNNNHHLHNNNYVPLIEQDWTLPNEAFNVRHEIEDRSPPLEQIAPKHNSPDINNDDGGGGVGGHLAHVSQTEEHFYGPLTVVNPPKKVAWDCGEIVIKTLRFHADLGDVQTAASVLLVLGDQRTSLDGLLDEATQEHWLLGYIDLLSRYKLWDVAAQVIKLSWIPSVNRLSQQSTRINSNCGKCSKPLQRAGWLCDRCHSSESSLCAVCHQVVKGLYVWCQGCSHGGHLAHVQNWMRTNNKCPTGCGHLCEYG